MDDNSPPSNRKNRAEARDKNWSEEITGLPNVVDDAIKDLEDSGIIASVRVGPNDILVGKIPER